MQKILLAFSILVLSSCAHYGYTLVSPTPTSELTASNDTCEVLFKFQVSKPRFIYFTYRNKLNEPIKLLWDDASMSVDGYTYKILNKNTHFSNNDRSMPPTNIPAKQYLKEIIAPSEKVKLKCDRNKCDWVVSAFLPRTKSAAEVYDGKDLVILLPIQIGDKIFNQSYTFKINLIN